MSSHTTSEDLLDQIAHWANQIPEAGPIRMLLLKRPSINVSAVLQAHIDYHHSCEAAAKATGAVASEQFHYKSGEYLGKIKRGEPPTDIKPSKTTNYDLPDNHESRIGLLS